MVYLHPLLGAFALALLLYTASLGIRSRQRPRLRPRLLSRHARIAPAGWALVALAWCAGAASTALLRDDLDLAQSTHFLLGTSLLAVMSAGFWTSRIAVSGSDNAREIHVWLGIAAILLAVGQAFTGLRITP